MGPPPLGLGQVLWVPANNGCLPSQFTPPPPHCSEKLGIHASSSPQSGEASKCPRPLHKRIGYWGYRNNEKYCPLSYQGSTLNFPS